MLQLSVITNTYVIAKVLVNCQLFNMCWRKIISVELNCEINIKMHFLSSPSFWEYDDYYYNEHTSIAKFERSFVFVLLWAKDCLKDFNSSKFWIPCITQQQILRIPVPFLRLFACSQILLNVFPCHVVLK